MSRPQFIALLSGYALVDVVHILSGKYVRLPDHVERAKANREEILRGKPGLHLKFLFALSTFLLVAFFIGIVGMFFFLRIAPWLFGVGVIGMAVFHPKKIWIINNGWEHALNDLESLFAGVILALVFFGPAQHLFFR
jgi:hypothetical protein